MEDNGRNGIFYETSIGATIRNNTVRRNAGDAVLISMSQNAQIYNNSLEANFGGIQYFLNCAALASGARSQEQCGVRQHGRRRHAERRVRERLQLHLRVHLNTAGAVSEWLEEPDLLPQHLPRAITHWPVLALGRLEVLE